MFRTFDVVLGVLVIFRTREGRSFNSVTVRPVFARQFQILFILSPLCPQNRLMTHLLLAAIYVCAFFAQRAFACTSDSDCADTTKQYCDQSVNVCRSVQEDNTACARDSQCVGWCNPSSLLCTSVPLPLNTSCSADHVCSSGFCPLSTRICTAKTPVSSSCSATATADSQCLRGWCDADLTCKADYQVGQHCARDLQCGDVMIGHSVLPMICGSTSICQKNPLYTVFVDRGTTLAVWMLVLMVLMPICCCVSIFGVIRHGYKRHVRAHFQLQRLSQSLGKPYAHSRHHTRSQGSQAYIQPPDPSGGGSVSVSVVSSPASDSDAHA